MVNPVPIAYMQPAAPPCRREVLLVVPAHAIIWTFAAAPLLAHHAMAARGDWPSLPTRWAGTRSLARIVLSTLHAWRASAHAANIDLVVLGGPTHEHAYTDPKAWDIAWSDGLVGLGRYRWTTTLAWPVRWSESGLDRFARWQREAWRPSVRVPARAASVWQQFVNDLATATSADLAGRTD
jgi:hypothetical protein